MTNDKSPPDNKEVNNITDLWNKLENTSLIKGMTRAGFFNSLPQIEEDLYRQLSYLLWSMDNKEKACVYFLKYLNISTNKKLDSVGMELMN